MSSLWEIQRYPHLKPRHRYTGFEVSFPRWGLLFFRPRKDQTICDSRAESHGSKEGKATKLPRFGIIESLESSVKEKELAIGETGTNNLQNLPASLRSKEPGVHTERAGIGNSPPKGVRAPVGSNSLKPAILVAEGDEKLREDLRIFLCEHGFEVIEAVD